MVALASLWLAVLLATVAVFFLSFVMWMVLPHHRSDFRGLPDEDEVLELLRQKGVGRGQYHFPYCADPKEGQNPEFVKKYERGPTGMMVVRAPGPVNMGKNLAVSFAFNLIVSIVVGYVATIGMTTESSGTDVFRLTATVAFLAYSAGISWSAIWWSRTWSSVGKEILDGLAYGLATGAIFAFLWPGA